MRIALTNPFCWPWVRRGSERLLNDLSHFLAQQGHEVTVISTAPVAARTVEQDGPVRRVLLPQRLLQRIGRRVSLLHVFAAQVRAELGREDYDLVHCLNYHDAAGASAARGPAGRRPRLVLLLAGIPNLRQLWTRPLDWLLFHRALHAAETVQVVSQAARMALARDFGVDSVVLPPPVHTERFAAHPRPAPGAPVVLFVGDLAERRKGARPLALAFARLRQQHPDARLQLSGHAPQAVRAEVLQGLAPDVAEAVEFFGVGDVDTLPPRFAAASVLALPAIWEAFGMVLVEALAAGTPVVGCRHGGITEVLTDPRVGQLVEPGSTRQAMDNVAGLAQALAQAVQRAAQPDTAALCREHASRYSWQALGPHYLALYGRPRAALNLPVPFPRPAAAAWQPRVTVVVPTWRRPVLLERLLRSLLVQDYPAGQYEVLVVHREQGDGTAELVQRLGAGSAVPLRAVFTRYRGPGGSRHDGALAGTGEVLAFIDDDCEAAPGWLAAGVAALEPGVGLVQGCTLPHPQQLRRMFEQTNEITGPTPMFETCNIFYRREAFEQVDGFSPDYRNGFVGGEDADLGWKVLRAGWATGFAPLALVYHEVFKVTPWQWLMRPKLLYGAIPPLVARHPPLRDTLFMRVFLTRFQALLLLLLAGAVLAWWLHPAFALLALPYGVARYHQGHRYDQPGIRLLRTVAGLPRAVLGMVVLAWQSLRSGSLVL